jgi:hypothetical protein
MDFRTMLVDMLRNSKEEEILNQGGPLAKAPAPAGMSDEMSAGMAELTVPGYAAYKREALSLGEPVMSPEEFKNASR